MASERSDQDVMQYCVELREGLSASRLQECLKVADGMRELGLRALAYYLLDMQERGLHLGLGYASARHFAEERLALGSRRRARDLMRVARELRVLRTVDEALARGELSWSRAEMVARVAVPETEQEWIEESRAMSCDRLKHLVSGCRKGDRPNDGRGLSKARFRVVATFNAAEYEMWERARKKLEAERGSDVLDRDMMLASAEIVLRTRREGGVKGRRVVRDSAFQVIVQECPKCEKRTVRTEVGPVDLEPGQAPSLSRARRVTAPRDDGRPSPGSPLPSAVSPPRALRSSQASSRLRDFVIARDGHRCRLCGQGAHLHAHHIKWRSRGGPTEANNLVTLCTRCHGLVHQGMLHLSGTAAKLTVRRPGAAEPDLVAAAVPRSGASG